MDLEEIGSILSTVAQRLYEINLESHVKENRLHGDLRHVMRLATSHESDCSAAIYNYCAKALGLEVRWTSNAPPK